MHWYRKFYWIASVRLWDSVKHSFSHNSQCAWDTHVTPVFPTGLYIPYSKGFSIFQPWYTHHPLWCLKLNNISDHSPKNRNKFIAAWMSQKMFPIRDNIWIGFWRTNMSMPDWKGTGIQETNQHIQRQNHCSLFKEKIMTDIHNSWNRVSECV